MYKDLAVIKKISEMLRKNRLKTLGVRFERRSYVDKWSTFEGRNVLQMRACVTHSDIGYGSYIGAGSKIANASVGRYCSIGPDVSFVIGVHPVSEFVSTHPCFFSISQQAGFSYTAINRFNEYGPSRCESDRLIKIGSDVWLGYGCKVLQGVEIGHGAIVAAGAVVTRDVQPYSVVGGAPAKVIRMRFDQASITKLLSVRWWEWEAEVIQERAMFFSDLDSFLNRFYTSTL